jgi:hypothetical protein
MGAFSGNVHGGGISKILDQVTRAVEDGDR